MNSPKTREGLRKLVALSLVIQNMPGEDLAKDKLQLSLALQELAKFLGDAHGIAWRELIEEALADMISAIAGETADEIAAAAIRKAMGHKPH